MSRRDNVLAVLTMLSKQRQESANIETFQGFSTEEIAQQTGILRSNCSMELNALVREGRVTKVQGRPTLYRLTDRVAQSVEGADPYQPGRPFAAPILSTEFHLSQGSNHGQDNSSIVGQGITDSLRRKSDEDFDWGVASDRSLHDAVQQAKIALTYPSHGMHVLLLGETGVGKSTFAQRMHGYSVVHGVLRSDAPFISFNCAEYANNPEILLDQLFGHARGAYTGAHSDKPGLVEQAHEGVIFLDEVHRLPPQGQEMLFHLLDYGEFRRLGETQGWRQARVLLVAATTESPESALLSTFRRRIPVVIRIPALRDWTLYDRYELVYFLCREESRGLGRTVRIAGTALDTLLFSHFPANIGDLKNTLRLACARAYRKSSSTVIYIRQEDIVTPVGGPNEALLRRLTQSADLEVEPGGTGPPPLPMLEEGSRHAKLDRLSHTLHELGFATEEILGALERELQKQDQGSHHSPSSIAELRQFTGESFYSVMAGSWDSVAGLPDLDDSGPALLRVAMHLFGLAREGRTHWHGEAGLPTDVIERVKIDSPLIYDIAGKLLKAFSDRSGMELPEQEAAIVTMLLRPTEGEQRGQIGIVVALYGEGVARQMVAAALRLSSQRNVIPVDIPFQAPVEVMDIRLTESVLAADQGSGVLLLTDVPYFAEHGNWPGPETTMLERIYRPDLRTVVSALQSNQGKGLALSDIANWLRQINRTEVMSKPRRKLIVWGCCLTGQGTARAVVRLIQDALPTELQKRVEVVPKELGRTQLPQMNPEEDLVAAVGSVDPGIVGVPFFSVETLLSKDGIEQLLNVLYMEDSAVGSMARSVAQGGSAFIDKLTVVGQELDTSVLHRDSVPAGEGEANTLEAMESYIRRLLERDLVLVNPAPALSCAKAMWKQIETALPQISPTIFPRRETFIRFCLHTAYVIERLVRKEGMIHPYVLRITARYPEEWAMLRRAWEPIQSVFQLPPNDHELAYLFELVFADKEVEVFEE